MDQLSNPITVIDRFLYPKSDGRHDLDLGLTLTKSYQQTIRQMESCIRYVNREGKPVTLIVAGDPKSGIRFLVQSEDTELTKRATATISEYLEKLDRDFLA